MFLLIFIKEKNWIFEITEVLDCLIKFKIVKHFFDYKNKQLNFEKIRICQFMISYCINHN
jgi:hypothetical protein